MSRVSIAARESATVTLVFTWLTLRRLSAQSLGLLAQRKQPGPCGPLKGTVPMLASLRSDGSTTSPEHVDGFVGIRIVTDRQELLVQGRLYMWPILAEHHWLYDGRKLTAYSAQSKYPAGSWCRSDTVSGGADPLSSLKHTDPTAAALCAVSRRLRYHGKRPSALRSLSASSTPYPMPRCHCPV